MPSETPRRTIVEQPDLDPNAPSPPRGDLVEALRDMIERYSKPVILTAVDPLSGADALVAVSHDGVSAIPASVFDDYLLYPRARRGVAKVLSVDSFVEHVDRFRSDATVIFADDDRAKPKLTAVLDYHPAGSHSDPAHGRHRTLFEFPKSDEWIEWCGSDGKKMGMADFAAFLEDRVLDVDDAQAELGPDVAKLVASLGGPERIASPSQLVELSRGLSVHENSAVREAVKLSSGEGEVMFQNEHLDAAGERLVVPTMFLLAIPVFRNDAPYQLLARLRYRKTGAGLVFWYELSRADRVFDHAFKEAVEKVRKLTGSPVIYGSPEA